MKLFYPLQRASIPMIVLLCIMLSGMSRPCSAQQIEQITILLKSTTTVNPAGNAHAEASIKFEPARVYDRFKQAYPNLYVLFRDLGNQRAASEIDRETLSITAEDGQRSIGFKANIMGAAVRRTNGWQIPLDKNEDVVTQDGNKVFTSAVSSVRVGVIMNMTNTYLLPGGAQNVKVDKQKHLLTYTLPAPAKVAVAPQIDFSVRFKKNLMSSLYKIYADPEVGDGRYWTGKAIVKNTGMAPIYDLKISYKLGEYAEDGFSETYAYVMPGGSVVDLYYPVVSSKVVSLRTRTPMRLNVKCEYKDAAGKSYEEHHTENISMMGINQFEYCNLSEEDKTDSWADSTNNAPLIAAYVTKLDEPVKKFAGYISQLSGGAPASINKEGALRWLKAAYDLQLLNKFVYQTPSGDTYSQDLKYPRDVFAAKSGTCIDLAIMYASLAESVGLHSYLMFVPGHCFAVIILPDGTPYPVENTGIGGGDKHMTFEQASQAGDQEFRAYQAKGVYHLIDVEKEQNEGRVPVPDLTKVEDDFLQKSNILPADQLGAAEKQPAEKQPASRPRVVMGITMGPVAADKKQALNIGGGVEIATMAPGLPADAAGLQAGDIIVALGGQAITAPPEFQQAIMKYVPGQSVTVSAFHGSEKRDYTVKLISLDDALGFNGVWDGTIGQVPISLRIKQGGDLAEGTFASGNPLQSSGDFRKAAIGKDGSIHLFVRAVLSQDSAGETLSVDLKGVRNGSRIEGNGTIVVRNALGIEKQRINVRSWVVNRRP